MKRRSFLQLIGMGSAAIPMVTDAAMRLDLEAAKAENIEFHDYPNKTGGPIRFLRTYSVEWDRYHIRYDICDDRIQLGIDVMEMGDQSTEDKIYHRNLALEELRKSMVNEGMRFDELITLPADGYKPENYGYFNSFRIS